MLYRDAHLLALYKPSGLPTTSPDGKRCLTEVASALDPQAPQLQASSRLDAEVTGLVTFARTGKAIQALSPENFDGKTWQRWSRHRTQVNLWRPGVDGLATQYALVQEWLERELRNP